MNILIKKNQWIVKCAASACLLVILLFVINKDYRRLCRLFPESWSLQSVFYVDQVHIQEKALLKTFNQLMPSTIDLANMLDSPQKLDERTLRSLTVFYEKISEHVPTNADTHGLLGLCYYQLGKEEKAMTSYRRSIELNPHFFWSYYNLGLIYFKSGQYPQAVNIFKYALSLRPEITLTVIASSRVYSDIIKATQLPGETVKARLQKGYDDALKYLVESASQGVRGKSSGVMTVEKEKISLQVF